MSTAVIHKSSFPLDDEDDSNKHIKHKRRFCRHPGCSSIVKSQGLCQRHGAKPRLCKVEGCKKQSQGNFNGMCKAHFKIHRQTTIPLPPPPPPVAVPPPPQGQSVYDDVIPASVAWRPESGVPMPLIKHLKDGFDDPSKPSAWHRNEERRARGLWPVHNPALQLEGWERELVWAEILLLTGNPNSSFRHLARAWGRDKGFHTVLAQFICNRRGNVERKKRRKTAGDGDSKSTGTTVSFDVVGGDLLDDHTLYGDAAYNEALAADLFTFESADRQHRASSKTLADDEGAEDVSEGNERMHSFEMTDQTKKQSQDYYKEEDVGDDEIEEILVSSEEDDQEEYTDAPPLEAI